MRRTDGLTLAAAVAAACGLFLLLAGTAKASPLVFFGTPEERAGIGEGRRLMVAATALLVLAAALFAARGRVARAALVASPGIVATAPAYAFPKTAAAWLPVLVLGTAAFIAAVTALAPRRG